MTDLIRSLGIRQKSQEFEGVFAGCFFLLVTPTVDRIFDLRDTPDHMKMTIPVLRTNIFRTQCTAKGKVCTVIIDGGSCEIMVYYTWLKNLGLPIQIYPDPYKLTWPKLASRCAKAISTVFVCDHIAKTQHTYLGLYTLTTPEGPWEVLVLIFGPWPRH
ncbi:hypothetical protein Tco_0300421 [Tanacetum coccineum]